MSLLSIWHVRHLVSVTICFWIWNKVINYLWKKKKIWKEEEKPNGSTNLILHNDRQQAFKQYCCKKVKEPLSAFLPDFPGSIDNIEDEVKAASTLGSILEQNIVKKEIHSLTASQLTSFRLYPGAVNRYFFS